MISATEQQLALVTRRTQRLEQTLTAHIDEVRRLKGELESAQSDVASLRSQLAAAEQRESQLQAAKDEAASTLKQTASEYAKAQLLRKKYHNTLAELQGYGRAYVVLPATFDNENTSSPFVVADECTINAPESGKAFTVDGVAIGAHSLSAVNSRYVGEDDHSSSEVAAADAVGIRASVDDALKGFNVTYFAMGPMKSGKSTLMWGPPAVGAAPSAKGAPQTAAPASSPGLALVFLQHMFLTMEEHEVTHFNMSLSMGECYMEQFFDLLTDYSTAAMGVGRNHPHLLGPPSGSSNAASGPFDAARSVLVQSFDDVKAIVSSGIHRHRSGKRGKGHVFLSVVVENFNVRGHFRKSRVLFVDIGGVPSGVGVLQGPEQQWLHRSLSSVCAAIAAISASSQSSSAGGTMIATQTHLQLPSATRRKPLRGETALTRLLGEALGGNAKAVMVATVNAPPPAAQGAASDLYLDEALGTLTYAHHFKGVHNQPVPHDIPAELQRLSMELRDAGEDEEMGLEGQIEDADVEAE